MASNLNRCEDSSDSIFIHTDDQENSGEIDTNIKTEVSKDEWYSKAEKYWSEIPATLDGVLGGFGFVSQIDIQASRKFLQQIFRQKNAPERERVLDCGAGIGRITKCLLGTIFEKVDLVEQNPAFLETFKNNLEPTLAAKVDNIYCSGLQNFTPKENFYDVIWIQWVLGHLTDAHLVRFLKDCGKGLKSNGIIVVKENITSSGEVELDAEESSVTRPVGLLKDLCVKSGLKCVLLTKQNNFPKGLYSVYMFALRDAS